MTKHRTAGGKGFVIEGQIEVLHRHIGAQRAAYLRGETGDVDAGLLEDQVATAA